MRVSISTVARGSFYCSTAHPPHFSTAPGNFFAFHIFFHRPVGATVANQLNRKPINRFYRFDR